MKQYGNKLRSAREFLGLTQEQVAKTLNMTRNMIVNIENNKRTIKPEELLAFSLLYGITMEDIILEEKKIDINNILFIKGFEDLSDHDKKEVLNLIESRRKYEKSDK